MRGKNRNPIEARGKLPQFTTMHVIEGQAGQVNYASLIFYSLTFNNILNIIVMLILVAVTVTMAVNGGLFEQAGLAGKQTNAKVQEELELAKGETLQELINKYASTTGTDSKKEPNLDCEICGGKEFYINELCENCGQHNSLRLDLYNEISQYGAWMYCPICLKETHCSLEEGASGDIKCSECNYRICSSEKITLGISVIYVQSVELSVILCMT